MTKHAYTRVQALLHDTNDAFLSCEGAMNTDYAEFASLSIADFRHVLKKPDLKRHELAIILRKSMQRTCKKSSDPLLWPIFMAKYTQRSSNTNVHIDKAYNVLASTLIN